MTHSPDTPTRWLGRALAASLTAALLAACSADAPLSPTLGPSSEAALAALPLDLGACQKLQAPAGSKLVSRMFARGVQIYRWTGAEWAFVAPDATLHPNATSAATIGTHFAGPTWQHVSGAKVVGAVKDRCPAGPNDIPWLLLTATADEQPATFRGVTHIQRLFTVGGVAPSAPGAAAGEIREVPYTAEYLFYRQ